ncbi:MAG: HAD-IA family hydrolase [Clostridia bacterium]|nr:HAD-IA family hydrolase [Clostridia bacterium]
MFKNYIWDFDGMLFDSYPHITTAFEKMMNDYGINIDYVETKRMLEISFATAYDYYGTTDEQKERFREYEHDFDLEPIAVPFANTIETLKKVHENGGKNFLYTHRGASAFYYLKKYGVYDLFEDFVTSENGFPMKPCPDAVNHIVAKHNLNKNETVMIGDREIDVMSGKNAGTKGCLFTIEEKETQADFVVDDIIKTLDLEV